MPILHSNKIGIPQKIRKILLNLPLEKLLQSHSSFMGHRFSEEIGDESDFREYQNYIQGEDPKRIDWKVYARSDKKMVKKFSSEKSRNVYLFLDTSSSMGSEGSSRFTNMFYYLMYYLYLNNERFGIVILKENESQFFKSDLGISHIRKMENIFLNLKYEGNSSLSKEFIKVLKKLERESEILYFSDFQSDLKEYQTIVESANFQHLYLYLIAFFNQRVYDFPLNANNQWLRDDENHRELLIEKSWKKDYKKIVLDHYKFLKNWAYKKNIRYKEVDGRKEELDNFISLFD